MITLNTPQKLSSAVLAYLLLKSFAGSVVIVAVGFIFVQAAQYTQYQSLILIVVVALALVKLIYIAIWWKLFEYQIGEDYIAVKFGVIFRTDKSINFNDVQSINAAFGPLLALFGLRQVRGFTSSPEQLVITSTKSGAQTRHVPDIQILLDKQIAEELLVKIRKEDVQKVRMVQ